MKNIVIASLIAATSGLAAAPQASAKNNEGLAALGGFIGGLVVSTAIHDANRRPDYRAPAPAYCPPPAPAYAPPPPPVCEPPREVRYSPPYAPPVPRGYWEEVQVKTWVSERWVMSRDRWGRPVRVFQPGYYTYTTDRRWVSCG